jgi:hypothetical protein
MFIEKIEELGFILVPRPPYSFDLAPCVFFLFGHLKRHSVGKQFATESQAISTTGGVFDKIPLQTF